MRKAVLLITLAGVQALAAPPKEVLSEAKKTQATVDDRGRVSQKKVDTYADQTSSDLREYKSTLKQIENMKVYNAKMRELIQSQLAEMESIKEKMKNVTNLKKEILPLVTKMLDSLEQFVKLDVPFLKKERAKRVAELKTLMARADISISEKFRRVLEAYQVENEYGRTIESYNGTVATESGDQTVEFLRVGRMSLMYQGLDGGTKGRWDPIQGKFVSLEGKYKGALKEGLRVAKKQKAPSLIKIPVVKAAEVL